MLPYSLPFLNHNWPQNQSCMVAVNEAHSSCVHRMFSPGYGKRRVAKVIIAGGFGLYLDRVFWSALGGYYNDSLKPHACSHREFCISSYTHVHTVKLCISSHTHDCAVKSASSHTSPPRLLPHTSFTPPQAPTGEASLPACAQMLHSLGFHAAIPSALNAEVSVTIKICCGPFLHLLLGHPWLSCD